MDFMLQAALWDQKGSFALKHSIHHCRLTHVSFTYFPNNETSVMMTHQALNFCGVACVLYSHQIVFEYIIVFIDFVFVPLVF